MAAARRFSLLDWLLFLLVLVAAGGARTWYLCEYADCGLAPRNAVLHVQATTESVIPPVAPGYRVCHDLIEQSVEQYAADQMESRQAIRWFHVVLGALTAGFCFLLARRAFTSSFVGLLAGLFYAADPFAVIATGEMGDGVLVGFLLMLALALGARAGQQGGALTSYLYGLSLAGLSLLRLATAPFAVVAILWFLLRSRELKFGWFYAILAFLGFISGLAPWGVQTYQDRHAPPPVVDAAWARIWEGNNPAATGGPMGADPVEILGPNRYKTLQDATRTDRYEEFTEDVLKEVSERPFETVQRRVVATWYFFTGKGDFSRTGLIDMSRATMLPPEWVPDALYCTLFGMLFLALIGWRWSYVWRHQSMPLQLAVFWIPLPYILSHADRLHGLRLPLDGPLLCLAALTIGCVLPGLGGRLLRGEEPAAEEEESPPPLATP